MEWDTERKAKQAKKRAAESITSTKIVPSDKIVEFMECVMRPKDIVILEGDNQKQAVFLAKSLTKVNPQRIHDLHMVMTCPQIPEHLDIFDLGIARDLDFSFAGKNDKRIYQMIVDGKVKVGAIHTYLELYSRYFTDLTPNVVLCVAELGDKDGNLYTGNNTEDTPTIIEAAAYRHSR